MFGLTSFLKTCVIYVFFWCSELFLHKNLHKNENDKKDNDKKDETLLDSADEGQQKSMRDFFDELDVENNGTLSAHSVSILF